MPWKRSRLPHPPRGDDSRFNSATACYAVETFAAATSGADDDGASIRPRLVMPWKLVQLPDWRYRLVMLQFGHGLLCRGNCRRAALRPSARHASIRPRLVMPWKLERCDSRLRADHNASIRPRLVMPWKRVGTFSALSGSVGFNSATACYAVETSTRTATFCKTCAASIRPRLVMPWKQGGVFRHGLPPPALQFGHGLLCRGNSIMMMRPD